MKPLPEQLRPQSLSNVRGQNEVIDQLLQEESSGILWGPPGSGKTTIALLLAEEWNMPFTQLSATLHGVKDLRQAILSAQESGPTLLFIDEIHRWSRSQQDALLPHVESGTIRLIGATTEHPGHSMIPALLSRLRVYRLRPLSEEDLTAIITSGVQALPHCQLLADGLERILLYSEGDARRALLLLQRAAKEGEAIGAKEIEQARGERLGGGGRSAHYEIASAFIKSIRGSNPSAALYWLARAEREGEDPRFLARRMLILASEDIGLARPGAVSVAESLAAAVERLGEPECWISLAHGAAYLALCPKNWDSYQGLQRARKIVATNPHYPVPAPLRPPSKLDPEAGRDYKHASSGQEQEFLPPEISKADIFRKSD